MIERGTGALHLSDGVKLSGDLDVTAFLHTPLGRAATPRLKNPPWQTFFVRAAIADGTKVTLSLYFRAGKLKQIHMRQAVGPEIPEDDVKVLHDAWLKRTYGDPPWDDEPWGSIYSEYDRRADESSITITYGEPAP